MKVIYSLCAAQYQMTYGPVKGPWTKGWGPLLSKIIINLS